jgi:hypothetical protein
LRRIPSDKQRLEGEELTKPVVAYVLRYQAVNTAIAAKLGHGRKHAQHVSE